MEFTNNGRFSDTRVAGNEHQLWRAAFYDPIKTFEQCLDFSLPPVQSLGNQQPVGRVVFAKFEFVDVAASLPVSNAAAEIAFNAGSSLIALLGCLGEQLHNDC